MAKKNRKEQKNTPKQGISKPESFTQGMVSDLDPHFQLEGSYSDAKNIKLTNAEGDTFTVENINGNSLFVDLANYSIDVNEGQGGSSNVSGYHTFYDRGPDGGSPPVGTGPLTGNLKLDNRASIVGHVSFGNQILFLNRSEKHKKTQKVASVTNSLFFQKVQLQSQNRAHHLNLR